MSLSLPEEAARRRTFAIISHPDAGKTTLTENLLIGVLFTIVSIARSFALRRAFEAIRVRSQTGQRAVPEAGSKVNHG